MSFFKRTSSEVQRTEAVEWLGQIYDGYSQYSNDSYSDVIKIMRDKYFPELRFKFKAFQSFSDLQLKPVLSDAIKYYGSNVDENILSDVLGQTSFQGIKS